MTSPSSQPMPLDVEPGQVDVGALAAPRAGLVVVLLGLADGLHVLGGGVDAHACSQSTPGLRRPSGIERRLRRAPGGRERLRALRVVPAAVVAADRVVVGDRAAGGEHRVARDGLDRGPLRDLLAALGGREHREVGRRAVGVGVREPAGDRARAAERLLDRARHRLDERREPVPRDRRLERLRQHAHRHERVAQVRRAQERVPPRGRAAAAALGRTCAAVRPADGERRGRAPRRRPPRTRARAGPRSPANVSAASRADTSRQLAGRRPDCTIARTASQPAANDGNVTDAPSGAPTGAGARAPTPA